MLFKELSNNQEELTIFNCLSYYNETKTISTNKLNLHLIGYRFSSITYIINSIKPDLQNILNVVYCFYNKIPLTMLDLNLIKNKDDILDYVKDAKQKILNNEKVFRCDIMGDLIFIENIIVKDTEIYICMVS